MDRTEVVTSVAGDLHATELAIDAAITQATTLVQSFIGARAALSLSPVSGTVSQAKAMETIAALSAARESIVACHAELQKITAASASVPTPPARSPSPTIGSTPNRP